jgi:hypothetical protein
MNSAWSQWDLRGPLTTENNGKRMYSFDTSVFMDWQARFYPPDVFISLVGRIEGLIVAGQYSAVELVKEEIDAVSSQGGRPRGTFMQSVLRTNSHCGTKLAR